jgi:hypothetical protein
MGGKLPNKSSSMWAVILLADGIEKTFLKPNIYAKNPVYITIPGTFEQSIQPPVFLFNLIL